MDISDDNLLIFRKFRRFGPNGSIGWNILNTNKHRICNELIKIGVLEIAQLEKNDDGITFQYYKLIRGSKLPRRETKKSIILYCQDQEFILKPSIKRQISHKVPWISDCLIIDSETYSIYFNERTESSVFFVKKDNWYECKDINFRKIVENPNDLYLRSFSFIPPLKKSLDYLISQNS